MMLAVMNSLNEKSRSFSWNFLDVVPFMVLSPCGRLYQKWPVRRERVGSSPSLPTRLVGDVRALEPEPVADLGHFPLRLHPGAHVDADHDLGVLVLVPPGPH